MKITEIKNSERDDERIGVVSDSVSSNSDDESESCDLGFPDKVEAPVAGKIFSITPELQQLLDEKDKKIKKLEKKLSEKKNENAELKLHVRYLKEDAESENRDVSQWKSGFSRFSAASVVKTVAITAGFVLAALATVAALGFVGAMIAPFALPILGAGLLVAAVGVGISKIIEHNSKSRNALPVKSTIEREDLQPASEPDFVF